MRCGAVRWGAVWCGAVRYGTTSPFFLGLVFRSFEGWTFVTGASCARHKPVAPVDGTISVVSGMLYLPYTDDRYERRRSPSSLATSPPALEKGERSAVHLYERTFDDEVVRCKRLRYARQPEGFWGRLLTPLSTHIVCGCSKRTSFVTRTACLVDATVSPPLHPLRHSQKLGPNGGATECRRRRRRHRRRL